MHRSCSPQYCLKILLSSFLHSLMVFCRDPAEIEFWFLYFFRRFFTPLKVPGDGHQSADPLPY